MNKFLEYLKSSLPPYKITGHERRNGQITIQDSKFNKIHITVENLNLSFNNTSIKDDITLLIKYTDLIKCTTFYFSRLAEANLTLYYEECYRSFDRQNENLRLNRIINQYETDYWGQVRKDNESYIPKNF